MSKRKHEGEKEKVVLAYSGGLDTSVILVWLVEKGEWDATHLHMSFPFCSVICGDAVKVWSCGCISA